MLQLKPERFGLAEAVSQPVTVCGKELIADNSGALYWPGQHTLLVVNPVLISSTPTTRLLTVSSLISRQYRPRPSSTVKARRLSVAAPR